MGIVARELAKNLGMNKHHVHCAYYAGLLADLGMATKLFQDHVASYIGPDVEISPSYAGPFHNEISLHFLDLGWLTKANKEKSWQLEQLQLNHIRDAVLWHHGVSKDTRHSSISLVSFVVLLHLKELQCRLTANQRH